MRNLWGILISYLFVGLIMVAAKFFEKSGREATRKFIHIMLCNWWFIAMYFFDSPIWAAFVPFTFVIINWVSYKKELITVMERGEKEKDGLGTVYYAISLMVLAIVTFAIHKPELGLIGILVMGYGDGLAAVIGKTVKGPKYKVMGHEKSIAGSFTMFFVTFLIVSLLLVSVPVEFWYIKSAIVALIIAIVEAIGIKGTDNITVPLLTSLMLYFFL